MCVLGSQLHTGPFIVSMFMLLGATFSGSGAILAGRNHWTHSKKTMSNPIGMKRTSDLEESFLQALDDHQGIIYKVCRPYCDNHNEEQDLFQEIIYQLWKAYPDFQNKSTISTWIYSIAMKTAMAPYRRADKVEYLEEIPEDAAVIDPDWNEPHDEFYDFFHGLNKVDRVIVSMLMEGYERGEIAAVVKISEEAVTMRMGRVRRSWGELGAGDR